MIFEKRVVIDSNKESMKIIVDTKNYTNCKYEEYFDGGTPENNPYVVGQVVAVKTTDENCEPTGKEELAVVLGVMTPQEVRLDLCGMTALEDIRPANASDVLNEDIGCCEKLRKECQGHKVEFDWDTYELKID